ncbi:MAG: hypothetical protein AAF170_03095 [Bacteroidota bacterium]
MPQFEVQPADQSSRFVRARSMEDVLRQLELVDGVVGEPEAGSGWCAVMVGEELWGRIRPRDRMRFRRD